MKNNNTFRDRLVTLSDNTFPSLLPDFAPLFKEHFQLDENEIIEIILESQRPKKLDSKKLALLGFVNSKEFEIPKKFLENLAAKGLQDSFSDLNCSLKIENVHLLNSKIKKFIAAFYRDYEIPISINMYITPSPDAPCLLVHRDFTEVFVLQLMGAKSWTFYSDKEGKYYFGPGDKMVLDEQTLEQSEKVKITSEVGDLLHIPPLLYHVANSVLGASIHLTISLNRMRTEHILKVLESTLMEEMSVEKYTNLSNDDFEALFVRALEVIASEQFKKRLISNKDKMMFLSRAKILVNGR